MSHGRGAVHEARQRSGCPARRPGFVRCCRIDQTATVSGQSTCIFMHRGHSWRRALMPPIARLHSSVGLAVGRGGCGRTCPRGVSARRSAPGRGYRPPRCRTRSAASALGIPAAMTNNGRPEDPRRTGSAWAAVRNLDVAAPITAMPDPACVRAPRPGRPPGFRSAEPSATSRPSSLRSSGTARGVGSSRRQNSPGRQGGTRG